MSVALDGSGDTAAALGALVVAALQARGMSAASVRAPAACGASVERECRHAVLHALVNGVAHAALLPVPAARPPHVLQLRDVGLEELGDALPPARLACYASPPPAATTHSPHSPRSLLDFADKTLAELYRVPPEDDIPEGVTESTR